MLAIARRTAGLWWRTWPRLIAIYLVGWLVRYWVLKLAVTIGIEHGGIWGSLVLALVPMARLLTYLAMFLVIRSATTGLQHLESVEADNRRGPIDVTLTAIMPFLVIYTAWKLVVEDYYLYQTAVSITTVYEGTRDQVSAVVNNIVGPSVWLVIIVAFLSRQLLTRFRERLPRWTMVLGVYLEILWLFLTIQASFAALFGTPEWIARRRIVVWWNETRESLFENFAVLGAWWDFSTGALGLLLPAVGLALAWIAIASAVYGTPFEPTWVGGRRTFLGHRGDAAAARAIERGRHTVVPRWQRLPSAIQSRVMEFLRGQLGRFASIADAGKLVLHGGWVPISFFILAYTALVLAAPSGAYFDPTVTDGWLFRAVALALGPHEWQWWDAYDDTIRVVIGALIEPIRICLIAATFWYCADQVRSSRNDHDVVNRSTTGNAV